MKATKLSVNALVLGLSFAGLGLAATACGGATTQADTNVPTATEKGAEASCGAASCGEKKDEAATEKGAEAACGAGSCG